MDLEKLIDVASGKQTADLLLTGGQVANVFSGEIMPASIATAGERIAGIGAYHAGARMIDLGGRYVIPGLIDAHIHIESSLLAPEAFAAAALPHGTAAIIADPHEIVNVGALEGWRYMIEAARGLPVDILYTVPSCVPATHMETSGAVMGAAEIAAAFEMYPHSPALAELMNYPGVLFKDPGVMEILRQTQDSGRRIDGHAPSVSGHSLNAYLAAGASSDHECTSIEEARDKMRRGMQIFIREGSGAKNLAELLPLVNADNYSSFSFCCDDRHAGDLINEGEIDAVLRKAVALGMPPVMALRLATINTARHYGLRDRGAIAPGYLADLVVVDNLRDFNISMVIKNGRVAYENGHILADAGRASGTGKFEANTADNSIMPAGAGRLFNSVHLPDIAGRLVMPPPEDASLVRVIEVEPEQILTRSLLLPASELNNPEICAAAVIERHGKNGNIGHGYVKGLGLRKGALASTVAHDSHNLVVAGCDAASMELAARAVGDMGGGLAVVADGRVAAALPLPVGGLMATGPASEVAQACEHLEAAARQLGCTLPAPFITLSFLALPVIPELRLTDCGLVDVNAFALVSPWVSGETIS